MLSEIYLVAEIVKWIKGHKKINTCLKNVVECKVALNGNKVQMVQLWSSTVLVDLLTSAQIIYVSKRGNTTVCYK